MKVDVKYMDEAKAPDRVLVGLGEDLAAGRELSRDQKDDGELLFAYRVWLACKRQKLTDLKFTEWSFTILEVKPSITTEMVDEAVVRGDLSAESAEAIRAALPESGEPSARSGN